MSLLAQAATGLNAVPADWLKNLVIVALAIASPLIAIYASRRTRVEPDPLRVQEVKNLVTKDECERAHSSVHDALTGRQQVEDKIHDQLFAKINAVDRRQAEQINAIRMEMHGMELRINATAEERTAKVHDRVNEILAAENATRGTLVLLTQQVASFGAKADRLAEKK